MATIKKFKDMKKIKKAIDSYFKMCEDNKNMPNKAGLNLAMEVFNEDVSALLRDKSKQYELARNAVKKAYTMIEDIVITQAAGNKINPTVGIMYLNSAYGYAQKSEVTTKEPIKSPTIALVEEKTG